jgi:hypothetical protein
MGNSYEIICYINSSYLRKYHKGYSTVLPKNIAVTALDGVRATSTPVPIACQSQKCWAPQCLQVCQPAAAGV